MQRPRRRRMRKSKQNKSLPVPATKPVIDIETERPSSQMMGMAFHSEYFKGPLPPPEYLRQYDEISPGAAKNMIDAGIRQTDHRISIETKVVDAQIGRADKGLWCGLTIGVLGVGGGICIAIFVDTAAATIAGSALSAATLVGLVSVFVYGTNSTKKERVQKSKDNP